MRRLTPARFPETLAFLMRRKALGRIGLMSTLAFSPKIQANIPEENKQRIVCVGGALTEIIYALEAQSCLIGVDTTSIYPTDALRLPQVGYARTLSAEGILALAPTRIVVTEEAGPPAVLRQITAAGIPVEILHSGYRFEGLIHRITVLGRLLKLEPKAFALIKQLNIEWAHLHSTIKTASATFPVPQKVLFLFAHSANRLMASGRQTGAHAMIEYAGAVNAISDYSGYKPLTPESLVSARPDVLLMTDRGLRTLGDFDAVLKLPGMMQTPAGRNKQVIAMEAGLLLGFGPRLPLAIKSLSTQFIRGLQS